MSTRLSPGLEEREGRRPGWGAHRGSPPRSPGAAAGLGAPREPLPAVHWAGAGGPLSQGPLHQRIWSRRLRREGAGAGVNQLRQVTKPFHRKPGFLSRCSRGFSSPRGTPAGESHTHPRGERMRAGSCGGDLGLRSSRYSGAPLGGGCQAEDGSRALPRGGSIPLAASPTRREGFQAADLSPRSAPVGFHQELIQ